jgi:hypothetical protein
VNFWYKKNKEKLICKSPNDIISGNFDSEKVDQDGIFYYKGHEHGKEKISPLTLLYNLSDCLVQPLNERSRKLT